MTRPIQHPELSFRAKRRLAGQAGAKKSHWRYGFGGPLSPADKGWAERVLKFSKEPKE